MSLAEGKQNECMCSKVHFLFKIYSSSRQFSISASPVLRVGSGPRCLRARLHPGRFASLSHTTTQPHKQTFSHTYGQPSLPNLAPAHVLGLREASGAPRGEPTQTLGERDQSTQERPGSTSVRRSREFVRNLGRKSDVRETSLFAHSLLATDTFHCTSREHGTQGVRES